jgi:hypothetical protein
MKKLISFFKDLWETSADDILLVLGFIITLGWFMYIANIVREYEGSIIGKIFFYVWSFVLAFLWLIHRGRNKED